MILCNGVAKAARRGPTCSGQALSARFRFQRSPMSGSKQPRLYGSCNAFSAINKTNASRAILASAEIPNQSDDSSYTKFIILASIAAGAALANDEQSSKAKPRVLNNKISNIPTKERSIAIITGAGGSMGRAISKELVKNGYRIVAVDINATALATLREELTEMGQGRNIITIPCDISKAEDVNRAFETISESWDVDKIDALVNNAGILSSSTAATTTPEEFVKVMSINVNGAFYWSRAVLPVMRKKGYGRIVNTSALAAKFGGISAGVAYSVSKGALNALTISLARETAGEGITVNAISPAYVRTPMVTESLSQEEQDEVMSMIPVGRYCEPDEIAFTALFLLSPRAGFITGEILDQNGGIHMD